MPSMWARQYNVYLEIKIKKESEVNEMSKERKEMSQDEWAGWGDSQVMPESLRQRFQKEIEESRKKRSLKEHSEGK